MDKKAQPKASRDAWRKSHPDHVEDGIDGRQHIWGCLRVRNKMNGNAGRILRTWCEQSSVPREQISAHDLNDVVWNVGTVAIPDSRQPEMRLG